MPPSDLAKLLAPEQKLLAEIDRGIEGNAELIIPNDATPKALLAIINGLTGIISNSEKRIAASVPILGRALYMARTNIAFLQECGYKRIGDFVDHEIRPHMSRTTAYAVSVIWETLPEVTIAECIEIGTPTLLTATRFLGENPSPDFVEKVMTMARSSESDKDFKKKLAEAGNIVDGALDTRRLTISGPVPDINDLMEHLSDSRFQRWALEGQLGREDFKDAHLMILAAIEHSISEWPEEEQSEIPPHAPLIQDSGPGGY